MSIDIRTAPKLLQWQPCTEELVGIHDQYVNLACDALGYFLSMVRRTDPILATEIQDGLEALNDVQWARLLTAPEFTHRLFFRREEIATSGRFIANAITAERLREGQLSGGPTELWAALGDFHYQPSPFAQGYHAPRMGALVPLDTHSPYAMKISVRPDDETADSDAQMSDRFTEEEERTAIVQVQEAFAAIEVISPRIGECIQAFTKVLILRKDGSALNSFTSSSSGQFTARTMLVNPHVDYVAGALLADGIVHESIHSVLYMLERKYPWVHDLHLYFDASVRVTSPWSGRALRLRPFLQACFVWFGLLHFWNMPQARRIFGDPTVEVFAARARKGFLQGNLLDLVAEWRSHLDAPLLEAINTMQQIVLAEGSLSSLVDLNHR